jgi:parallel beta-helix repeat protein
MSNHERSITRSARAGELRKKKISFKPRKSVLIILLILATSYLYQIKPVFSSTILVPAQYPTIQAALDHAAIGDTVQVAPGIYYEHVNVNKSVTIVGENLQTTIVDGTANGTIFDLDGSNIHISGFTIRNAGITGNAITSSKETVTSDNDWISNNIITTSQYGVYLSYSTGNRIFSNTFINNVFAGISVNICGSTNITANTIVGGPYGIKTTSSTNNIIVGNTISQSSYSIYLASASTGNTVRNNVLSGKTACVYSSSDSTTIDHNTLNDGATGVYLYNCKSGSVYYNTCKNSSYGIRLYNPSALTSSHTVSNNKILYTDWAIELVYSDGNTLTGNWLKQNTYGVYMSSSSSNTFYRNNFVNNKMQASAGTGSNTWSKSISGKNQGNYWSDYTGNDTTGDGVGDTNLPYRIAPIGSDNYPLVKTWSEHDIAVVSVSTSTNQVDPGTVVNVTVKVRNNANTSVSETFAVTARYNSANIETKAVTNLAQGATQILTFNWNTAGVAAGNYTISAVANIVPDELNTDNNNYNDGTVKIKAPILGDINGDGSVNNNDLTLLVQAFGATPSSPGWNPEKQKADLNKDNVVDTHDLRILGKNYGRTA